MFRGYDAEGINRELSSIVECAALCRKNKKRPLATPEAALLSIASRLSLTQPESTTFLSTIPNVPRRLITSEEDICRGILPSLRHIVERDMLAYESSKTQADAGLDCAMSEGEADKSAIIADMNKNPLECSEDPRGNDYYCKLCHAELPNVYYHCDGCENLLHKDFNICANCYVEKKFKTNILMHKTACQFIQQSTINHTGSMPVRRVADCNCHAGRKCMECDLCTKCSCDCHTKFTAHFRKMAPDDLAAVLDKVEKLAGPSPLKFEKETGVRLKVAADRYGEGFQAKRQLLASLPGNGCCTNHQEIQVVASDCNRSGSDGLQGSRVISVERGLPTPVEVVRF